MATVDPELPFKSRTQVRDFKVLAIYKSQLDGAAGKVFNSNVQLKRLPDFRCTYFCTKLGEGIDDEDTLGIVCFHNVRAFVRKDAVSFQLHTDPRGTEMISIHVHDSLKGYCEPLN